MYSLQFRTGQRLLTRRHFVYGTNRRKEYQMHRRKNPELYEVVIYLFRCYYDWNKDNNIINGLFIYLTWQHLHTVINRSNLYFLNARSIELPNFILKIIRALV